MLSCNGFHNNHNNIVYGYDVEHDKNHDIVRIYIDCNQRPKANYSWTSVVCFTDSFLSVGLFPLLFVINFLPMDNLSWSCMKMC